MKYRAVIRNLKTPDGKTIQSFHSDLPTAEEWANKQVEHNLTKLIVDIYELTYTFVGEVTSPEKPDK